MHNMLWYQVLHGKYPTVSGSQLLKSNPDKTLYLTAILALNVTYNPTATLF